MFAPAPLPRNFSAAVRDVAHEKERVRLSAAQDLARFINEPERSQARDLLHARLKEDQSPAVQARAARSLIEIGDATSVPFLCGLGQTQNPAVLSMLLAALAETANAEDEAALSLVRRSLDFPSPQVRYQALIAAEILDPGFEPALARALGDDDSWIRYLAVRLTEQRICEKKEVMPPGFMDRIGRLASEDPAPSVQLAAAIVLVRAGDQRGTPRLVELVNGPRKGFKLDDEHTAMELVGERQLESARPGLTRRASPRWVLWPDPLVWSARIALAKMGDSKAKSQILRGLGAWGRADRCFAVVAAGQVGLKEAEEAILAMRGHERRADPEAVDEALRLLSQSSNCS